MAIRSTRRATRWCQVADLSFDEFAQSADEGLRQRGFVLAGEDKAGPMGSGEIRYSSGRSDVVLHSDRGLPAVTMGPRGAFTYGYRPWADLLGLEVDPGLDVHSQLEFLLEHADRIEEMIERDPRIDERLRELNWRVVKEHLGLDPNMPRPGHER